MKTKFYGGEHAVKFICTFYRCYNIRRDYQWNVGWEKVKLMQK